MPPMSGRRGKGRLSIYLEDEEGKEEVQGYTTGVVELHRVQEGLGEIVTGCAPPESAPQGKMGDRDRKATGTARATGPGQT